MDPVREAVHAVGGDVDLEREATAGRAGRAEQPATAGPLGDAHDTGGEVQ
jgi:hypothetical protein